jgi:predicted acetyltransferase
MRETVLELHEAGQALSVLLPATFSFYRAVGYEGAGTKGRVSVAASRIGLKDRELPLRPIEESDEEAICEVQRENARRFPGHLDRNPFIWRELLKQSGRRADGSLVEVEGRIEGYVYSVPQILTEMKIDLHVVDLVALTERAGRRLLTFLSDHRAQITTIHWQGHAADPLLSLFPEPTYRIEYQEPWMLRVVDVPAALSGRGYPVELNAELHLSVRDPLLPQNEGSFVVEVSNGLGQVKRGGAGRLQLDVRGLAPLYTGHLSPAALRLAGLLDGPEEELRCAAALFGGPAPWFTEGF